MVDKLKKILQLIEKGKGTVSVFAIFKMDELAATLCEDPSALCQALEKLSDERLKHAFPVADLHPTSAVLFLPLIVQWPVI